MFLTVSMIPRYGKRRRSRNKIVTRRQGSYGCQIHNMSLNKIKIVGSENSGPRGFVRKGGKHVASMCLVRGHLLCLRTVRTGASFSRGW